MSSKTLPTIWGFVRENSELAEKAGIDKDTGLPCTSLEDYLAVIFPNTNDWIRNKTTGFLNPDGKKSRSRPDYRSDSLKLIIEVDGLKEHYTNPKKILSDKESTEFYKKNGYTVVRIPYFIQLTQQAVKQLFGVDYPEQLFDPTKPSIGPLGNNTPAFLCPAGITRMAEEFAMFPEQYKVNMEFLKKSNNMYLTRYDLLEAEYNKIIGK